MARISRIRSKGSYQDQRNPRLGFLLPTKPAFAKATVRQASRMIQEDSPWADQLPIANCKL